MAKFIMKQDTSGSEEEENLVENYTVILSNNSSKEQLFMARIEELP